MENREKRSEVLWPVDRDGQLPDLHDERSFTVYATRVSFRIPTERQFGGLSHSGSFRACSM